MGNFPFWVKFYFNNEVLRGPEMSVEYVCFTLTIKCSCVLLLGVLANFGFLAVSLVGQFPFM